jgi:uncharacterized protein YbcC (UPF0753/DUF2309 family)
MKNISSFDEMHLLHELKHYLPSQTPLKDFIHHNSLHAFQEMKFFDAIFKASTIFGYQATLPLQDFRSLYHIRRIDDDVLSRVIANRKGVEASAVWKSNCLQKQYDEVNVPRIGVLRQEWKRKYKIDLDNSVQPLLFRILVGYLDQGIAHSSFPETGLGFLDSIRALEQNSYASFFTSSRAKQLLQKSNITISELLEIVVGNEAFYEQYIFDQQFSHRGWSGIVATVEDRPETLLSPKKISLHDIIVFELLLEIDRLDTILGEVWEPIAQDSILKPIDLFASIEEQEFHEILKIWQEAFEWSYYDEVLAGIQQLKMQNSAESSTTPTPSFQALFCIDERECSLRRHIESIVPSCETFGTPGFFSVEFYFQAFGAKFYDKLCPAPVTPQYLIKEYDVTDSRQHDLLYTSKTHQLATGFLSALTFGFWAGFRLIQTIFKPQMSPAISNAFAHMNLQGKLTIENTSLDDKENGLQVGFTVDEMTTRVAALLNGIALTKQFAPIVYVVAHGSSSANNPHHGAHDCGACSGRPGSVNGRVFAAMANHPKVRLQLQALGIFIPDSTQFVGALHDTAADEMEYYDVAILNAENRLLHIQNVAAFEHALDLNAKERSRRFASIDTKQDIKKIRKAIKDRSVSLFEPRPELGHGTNTLCVVGKRTLTKGLFLDRRAFLNSYDYEEQILKGNFWLV